MIERNLQLVSYKIAGIDNTIMNYQGPFDNKIVYILGNYLRQDLKIPKTPNKKLFSIFMELAQNIAFYSADTQVAHQGQLTGKGLMLLQGFHNHYLLTMGNTIQEKRLGILHQKLDLINSLNHDKLRALKRKQRKEANDKRGGADIGLIKVALASLNPIELGVYELPGNNSFVTLSAVVEKE